MSTAAISSSKTNKRSRKGVDPRTGNGKRRRTGGGNWKTFFEAHPPTLMEGPANLSTRTAYEEDDWDRQITADAASGKLDFLKKQAQTAKKQGKLRPLPE